MGGNSLFGNWLDGLRHMGIAAKGVLVGCPVMEEFERFRPTVFFTSDHENYLRWIDWDRLARYRASIPMALAMTASAEHDGNTPAEPRLKQALRRKVSFFVSFREPEYIEEHLGLWKQAGFDVLSIPFSANPIWHRAIPLREPPLDYVFLASINPEKAPRYRSYLNRIVRERRGVINGPGWGHDEWILGKKHHAALYGMAAVGLNLHIPTSLDIWSEVNERTFILAACGVFQLCDSPKVLRRFFPAEAVPAASSPGEYNELFKAYLADPAKRRECQKAALKAVYSGHTIFNRMAHFVDQAMIAISRSQ